MPFLQNETNFWHDYPRLKLLGIKMLTRNSRPSLPPETKPIEAAFPLRKSQNPRFEYQNLKFLPFFSDGQAQSRLVKPHQKKPCTVDKWVGQSTKSKIQNLKSKIYPPETRSRLLLRIVLDKLSPEADTALKPC